MRILGIRVQIPTMPRCTNCGAGIGFEFRQCGRCRASKIRYRREHPEDRRVAAVRARQHRRRSKI